MTNKENLIGNTSVAKLLLHYSIPSIISMLVVALYNVVDRIFIGQGIGAIAISGLAITLPLMSIVAAFGMLVGAGGSTRMSIALGKNNMQEAQQILGNVLMLIIIISTLLIIPTYICLEDIVMLFGASEQTLPYAMEYLRIIVPCTIFTNIAFSLCGLIRASGYPTKSMTIILIGVILNVILDPLFIFYFDMGIKGAAIATAISMFVTSILAIQHFYGRKNTVYLKRSALQLRYEITASILTVGLVPFFMNAASSLVNVILNNQLVKHGGDLAVGAWGIINSYLMIIITIIIGVSLGMQPIVGYNFGADKKKRMKDVLMVAIKASTVIMLIGFFAAELFAAPLVALFTHDPELSAIAIKGMRIVFMMTPIIGFQIIVSNFFQSVGQVPEAIFMTLSRQIIFLIPSMYIFASIWGLNGIWFAIPFSDIMSALVSILFLRKIKNKVYR